MRKNTKYIVSALLLFAITLGFASQNNLGINFANWGMQDDKRLEAKEVIDKIQSVIATPIREAIEKENPHMFMTKCYSDLNFTINGYNEQQTPEALIKSERTFYMNEVVNGSVILINCGKHESICSYRLHLEDNTVEVKESFFAEWKSLDELIKQISSTKI